MKKLIKISGLIFIFFVICFLILELSLITGIFSDFLFRKISSSIPGKISAEKFETSIITSQITINKLDIKDNTGENLFNADRIYINYSILPALFKKIVIKKIEVVNPNINIYIAVNGKTNAENAFIGKDSLREKTSEKKRNNKSPRVFINNLTLKGLRTSFQSSEIDVSLQNLDLLFQLELIEIENIEKNFLHTDLDIRNLNISQNDKSFTLRKINFDALLNQGNLKDLKFSASGENSELNISGNALNLHKKGELDFRINSKIDLEDLISFTDISKEFKGIIEIDSKINGNIPLPDVQVKINSNNPVIYGIESEKVDMSFIFQKKILSASADIIFADKKFIDFKANADLYGVFENFDKNRNMDFSKLTYNGHINSENIDILKMNVKDNIEFSNQKKFSIKFSGKRVDPFNSDIKIDILSETVLRNKDSGKMKNISVWGKINKNKEKIVIEDFTASDKNFKLNIDGKTDISDLSSENLLIKADIQNIAEESRFFNLPKMSGNLKGRVNIDGEFFNPDLTSDFNLSNIHFQDYKIGDYVLSAHLKPSGDLHIKNSELSNNDSYLKFSGKSKIFNQNLKNISKNPSFSLKLDSHLDIKDFYPKISGQLSLKGDFKGDIQNPKGNFHFRGKNIQTEFQDINLINISGLLDSGKVYIERSFALIDNSEADLNDLDESELNNFALNFNDTEKSNDSLSSIAKESSKNNRKESEKTDTLTNSNDSVSSNDSLSSIAKESSENNQKEPERSDEFVNSHHRNTDENNTNSTSDNVRNTETDENIVNSDRKNIQNSENDKTHQNLLIFSGYADFEKNFKFKLNTNNFKLENIKILNEKDISGLLNMNLKAEGNLINPETEGFITVKNLMLKDKNLEDISLDFALKNDSLKASAESDFKIKSYLNLKNSDFYLSADFDSVMLNNYFKLAGQDNFKGLIDGNSEFQGNLKTYENTEGHIFLDKIEVRTEENNVLSSDDFYAELKNGKLLFKKGDFQIYDTGKLKLSGNADIKKQISDIKIHLIFPLETASLFAEDLESLTGSVEIKTDILGHFTKPDVKGTIELKSIQMTLPVLDENLHSLSGKIKFSQDHINIEEIKGNINDGSFQTKGQISLNNFKPKKIDIQLSANNLPLNIPSMMEMSIDSEISFKGTELKSSVSGNVVLLHGLYYKDVKFNLLKSVEKSSRKSSAEPEKEINPFLKNMEFDISVSNRAPFIVENNIAEMEISPDIAVKGTGANPLIRGRMQVNSGIIKFQKKEFKIERGIIDFVNPYKIDPEIDIYSTAQIRDWNIFLSIKGTQENLEFTLESEPYLPHGDILSLLILGKTASEAAGGSAGGSQSTEQMLAEMVANTLGEDIKSNTGLDVFKVESGSKENSEAVKVTLGKKLTEKLSFQYEYETDSGDVTETLSAEYQLLEYLLLRAFQNTKGSFGGGLKLKMEF